MKVKRLNTLCYGLFFGLSVCLIPATANAAAAPASNDELPVAEIEKFFGDYLKLGEGTFETALTIEADKVEAAQKSVWEAWARANEAYKEDKLISLTPISNGKSSSWKIPAALESNAVMPYYYGYKGEKPENGYPLFLYLHGSGNKDNEWANGLKFANSFEDGPSVYFVPQIPNTGDLYRWWQKGKQWAWEKLLRQSFLSEDIDANRIYFFGISEGGYGSQRLASFYADYMAAAGPMAGGEPLKNAPVENCRNIAFSLRTGGDDTGFFRNKLTGYTKDEFEKLQKKYPGDFEHFIELIPGYGHQIDYTKTTPWLSNYVRKPHPKHVMWEDFDMDGIYRKGFYNLYVEEDPRGNFTYRIFYTMDIEDNDITLAVQKTVYSTKESQDGIDLKFSKYYSKINRGKVRIYLNDKLVDLSKPVKVTANGKVLFNGMVKANLRDMVNSCATFFDPERVFPASILIDLSADATGVEQVVAEVGEEKFYDLNGRPAADPQKGVYVNNFGKKVLF